MYRDNYVIPDISTPTYIDTIRSIFKGIDYIDKVATRRSIASQNCRSSQLKLLLFYIYLSKNRLGNKFFENLEEGNIDFLQQTYLNIKRIFVYLSESNSFIIKTYNLNNPLYVIKIETIDFESFESIDFYGIRIWPLCLYWEGRGIIHYFSLIKQNDNYFIFNSYGSDYVCIQPCIIPIHLEEFNNIIQMCLDESSTVDPDYFIKTYFIPREAGLDVEVIGETTELRGKSRMVDREKGDLAELGIYRKKDWCVGYIPVKHIIDEPSLYTFTGKGKKNKRTRKTNRTKRNRTKRNRTKRNRKTK